ncbi:MAG: hypothetical protein M1837_004215 [Sclerophora amabilis]|nr:MAG: hypothetical protein M1837_004215 [Sclerophora amabilis]
MGLPVFREPSESSIPAAGHSYANNTPSTRSTARPFLSGRLRVPRTVSPPRYVTQPRSGDAAGNNSTSQTATRARVPTARARLEAGTGTGSGSAPRRPVIIMPGGPAPLTRSPRQFQRENDPPNPSPSEGSVPRSGTRIARAAPDEEGSAVPSTHPLNQSQIRNATTQRAIERERRVIARDMGLPAPTETEICEDEEGRGVSLVEFLAETSRASERRRQLEQDSNWSGTHQSILGTGSTTQMGTDRGLRHGVGPDYGAIGSRPARQQQNAASRTATDLDMASSSEFPRRGQGNNRQVLANSRNQYRPPSPPRFTDPIPESRPREVSGEAPDFHHGSVRNQGVRDRRRDIVSRPRTASQSLSDLAAVSRTIASQHSTEVWREFADAEYFRATTDTMSDGLSTFQRRLDLLAHEFEMLRVLRRDLRRREDRAVVEIAEHSNPHATDFPSEAMRRTRQEMLDQIRRALDRLDDRLVAVRHLVRPPHDPMASPDMDRPLHPDIVRNTPPVMDFYTRQILETLSVLSRDDIREQEWAILSEVITRAQAARRAALPLDESSASNSSSLSTEPDLSSRPTFEPSSRLAASLTRSPHLDSTGLPRRPLIIPSLNLNAEPPAQIATVRSMPDEMRNIHVPQASGPDRARWWNGEGDTLPTVTNMYHFAWATLDHGGSTGEERLGCQQDLQRQFDRMNLRTTEQDRSDQSRIGSVSGNTAERQSNYPDESSEPSETRPSLDDPRDTVDIRGYVARQSLLREIRQISEDGTERDRASRVAAAEDGGSSAGAERPAHGSLDQGGAEEVDLDQTLEAASSQVAQELSSLTENINDVNDSQRRLLTDLHDSSPAASRTPRVSVDRPSVVSVDDAMDIAPQDSPGVVTADLSSGIEPLAL